MAVRLMILTGWLLAAVGMLVWHVGPGVAQAKLDDTAKLLTKAEAAFAEEDYADAIDYYNLAIAALPSDRVVEARNIRLAKAKAMMLGSKLPEAHADLNAMIDELTDDPNADAKLVAEVRNSLANAQYYTTWLMRLEGLGHESWGPEIDAARQNYRLLAEQAEAQGNQAAANKHREDLEAAIRLDRMELIELQGLNLPKQCKGCCSCKNPGKKQGNKPQKQPNDVRSAGGAPPLDDTGH